MNPNTDTSAQKPQQQQEKHSRVHEEISKFQQTMEDLRLLKNVTNDLKNYKRMIRIKRND